MQTMRSALLAGVHRLAIGGAACLAILIVGCSLGRPAAAADFNLWYVDHTGIEIVIAWESVAGATAYSVERDTAASFNTSHHVVYALDASVTGFGDTGWPVTDPRRFSTPSNPSASPVYHLESGTAYYYRVAATTPTGTRLSTVIGPLLLASYQSPSQIVRGDSGDLWADAVLGRPGFGENTWWKTEPYHIQGPGGVLVDRNTSHPTHVFIVDSNHNRILGMASLGRCSISQVPCSIDADCDGAACILTPGESAPQFVLGQPSATDAGACNGDGTMQIAPRRETPTASTLCLMSPSLISIGESVISIQLALDADHNLYVPDQWNHRVVMYRDPFNPANGTGAVAVWGQNDLTAGSGTLANSCPGGSTLHEVCLPNAVDIDAAGNLWVADLGHVRVLRFPRNQLNGTIAATADITLAPGSEANAVRVDPQGNVYVATNPHLYKFTNPQPGGSNAPQSLSFIESDAQFAYTHGLALDPTGVDRLWVQIRWDTAVRVEVATQQITKRVHANLSIGLDVSQAGDVFWTESADYIVGLYRLGAAEAPAADGGGPVAFLGFGVPTPDSMISALSIVTVGTQLLVSDRYTVYFWNDYHTITGSSAATHPPDGTWGQSPLTSGGDAFVVKTDTNGRIWIMSRFSGLKIYSAPLTSTSSPIKTFAKPAYYKDASGTVLPLPAGTFQGFGDFLPIGSGDRVWVEDFGHSRVMRVVNFEGYEDPDAPPYVDIVLGQDSFQGTTCNKGGGYFGFGRDTLCAEDALSVDPQGNFYIQDNATGGQDGGWSRILRWNAGTIPDDPPQTLFGILPDRVYGAGGDFTVPSPTGNPFYPYPDNDPAFPPRAAAYDPLGRMVLGGANPYAGARVPMVYLNKEQNDIPQLALGDTVSFPTAAYVDPEGNLYLGDFDWQRVLVYKQPLARFTPPPSPTPTSTPTGPTRTATNTRTLTPTPTITPTARDYRGIVLSDGAGPYYRLNEASGSTAVDSSALGINATYVSPGQLAYLQPALLSQQTDPAIRIVSSGGGVRLPVTASPVTETIEGWFKPTSAVDANALIVRVDSTGAWQRMLWITGGFPALNKFAYTLLVGGAQYNVVGTTTAVSGTTYHVVVSLNKTGNTSAVRLYVNGVQEAALDISGTPINADHWQIGLQGGGGLANLTGVMDEVAFYSTILSPAQVFNHWGGALPVATPTPTKTPTPGAPTVTNTPPAPTPTNTPVPPTATQTRTPTVTPIAADYSGMILNDGAGPYYRLNEASGSTAVDSSGLGLNAIYVSPGEVTYLQPALPPQLTDPAIRVSGAGAGVRLPVTASPVTETIEGWFKPTAAVDANALIVRVDSTGAWQRMLWITGGWPSVNKFAYSFFVSGTQYNVVGTTTAVTNGKYHVVVSLNKTGNTSAVRLYVNGVQEAAMDVPGMPINADHWQIGLEGGGGLANLTGVMDEVAFYGTILSPTQVANHYSGVSPAATPSATATNTPLAPTGTATPTATDTPVPPIGTATPTATNTPVPPTATPTPTPTATLLAVRGTNRNPHIDRRGCQVEWFVTNPNRPLDRFGLPKLEQICIDGDASCDLKSGESGVCEFQVAVCLNNSDASLPLCIPNGISGVSIRAPRPERVPNLILRAALANDLVALQSALLHLLDPANPGPGYVNAPPLNVGQQHFCSAPFAIDVPLNLGATHRSRRSVTLMTRSVDLSTPPLIDLSRLKLTCKSPPAP